MTTAPVKLPEGSGDLARALLWLSRAKRHAAWLACGLVALSGAIRTAVPQFLPFSLMLYLTVITSVLLEMYGRSTPERTIYASHQEGAGVFFSEIRAAVERPGRCDIAWIGVTLQSAWLTLENALGRAIVDCSVSNVHIRLLQSDPVFLSTILDGDDSCADLTREQSEHIARFARRNCDALRRCEASIEIAQYAHMPNFHGLLINGSVLYLSTVRWGGEDFMDLSVPHEPFERFDRSTERGQYMISLYSSWLEKGFATAPTVMHFPEAVDTSLKSA